MELRLVHEDRSVSPRTVARFPFTVVDGGDELEFVVDPCDGDFGAGFDVRTVPGTPMGTATHHVLEACPVDGRPMALGPHRLTLHARDEHGAHASAGFVLHVEHACVRIGEPTFTIALDETVKAKVPLFNCGGCDVDVHLDINHFDGRSRGAPPAELTLDAGSEFVDVHSTFHLGRHERVFDKHDVQVVVHDGDTTLATWSPDTPPHVPTLRERFLAFLESRRKYVALATTFGLVLGAAAIADAVTPHHEARRSTTTTQAPGVSTTASPGSTTPGPGTPGLPGVPGPPGAGGLPGQPGPPVSPPTTDGGLIQTTVTLDANPNPVTVGAPLGVRVTVGVDSGGVDPTGPVLLFDGSGVIAREPPSYGTAFFPTNTLPAGTHDLRAEYLGDAKTAQNWSNVSDVLVEKAQTGITIANLPHSCLLPSVTVTVTSDGSVGPPTGKARVALVIDTTSYAASGELSGGTATIALPGPTVDPGGPATLIATYSGDARFGDSSRSYPITCPGS